jgi:cell division protein ZapD
MENNLSYEYPLNENFRVCLRLEAMFAQAEFFLQQDGYWNVRAAVASIVDLINILDRSDFKGKILQQLVVYKEAFLQLRQDAELNQEKLTQFLQRIDDSITFLQATIGKLTQGLEKIDFLSSIRLRLAQAGGACNFDLPLYHYWLHLPCEEQKADLQQWYDAIIPVKKTVALLISLSRRSSQFEPMIAKKGFFEQSLDSKIEYQLLRFLIPNALNAYPDISIGRHRFSMHFFKLDESGKPERIMEDIEFQLARCT